MSAMKETATRDTGLYGVPKLRSSAAEELLVTEDELATMVCWIRSSGQRQSSFAPRQNVVHLNRRPPVVGRLGM